MHNDYDVIEAWESKWLDPDYDIYTHRYRSVYEQDEAECEMPLSDEESYEEELRILEHMKAVIAAGRKAHA